MKNEKFAATTIHVFCGKLLVEHNYLCSFIKPRLFLLNLISVLLRLELQIM